MLRSSSNGNVGEGGNGSGEFSDKSSCFPDAMKSSRSTNSLGSGSPIIL